MRTLFRGKLLLIGSKGQKTLAGPDNIASATIVSVINHKSRHFDMEAGVVEDEAKAKIEQQQQRQQNFELRGEQRKLELRSIKWK